jgi:hypothetical protein
MTADHVELYSSLLERPNLLSRLAARRSANRVAAGSHLAPAAGLGAG